MHGPRADLHRHVVEREDAGERLSHAFYFEQILQAAEIH
jgi:hypothetical protein